MNSIRSASVFALLALCASPGPLHAETAGIVTQSYASALGRVFGFCEGQALTVRRLKASATEMQSPLSRAELVFHTGTRNACQKTETILTEMYGEGAVEGLRRQLIDGMPGEASPQGRAGAEAFVSELEARSRWQIESPTRETMLAVVYADRPASEMIDGHVQFYDGDGSGKLRGLRLQLQLPMSWAAKPGNRPHMERKWGHRNGTGFSNFAIGVFPGGPEAAPGWAERVIEQHLEGDFLPDGTELIESGLFTLEGITGLRLQFRADATRLDVPMAHFQDQYMLSVDDQHILSMICGTTMPQDRADLALAEFEKIVPVCRQIANTLVLPDRY